MDRIPVAQAAAAFGFCRQTFYVIAAALDVGGPAALVPGKPGPKGPRKLTEEVMEFIGQLRAGDASLRSARLAEAVLERFGITVHPRSVEKAERSLSLGGAAGRCGCGPTQGVWVRTGRRIGGRVRWCRCRRGRRCRGRR